MAEAWEWNNESQPISIFRSRPDLFAPVLTPLEGIHQPEKMAQGYFFVAPYTNLQPGIYIYDNNANLVYSSFGSYGPGPSHAPRVCTFRQKPHLCYYQGVQHVGWGHGHGVIMDQNYRVVRSVEPSCTYQASSDMHEFYLSKDGTTAFMTQYVRSVYDLCPWGLCDGLGYIQAGWFQEVDVETGECLFSWNSLEHVAPVESQVLPASTEVSGDGESPQTPWDYFHINSVDKSSYDNGYLISARHVCAIYKVHGTTGQILWRLGGVSNEYEYDNGIGSVDFGFQHDARWISDSAEESVISVFDNGSNGYTETAGHSTGKIIRLNHKTKTARLIEPPLLPPVVDGHGHLSKSQGNFQLDLPGSEDADMGGQQVGHHVGNRILGFGNDPFFAEYKWTVSTDGATGEEVGKWEKVFYGTLAWGWMMNYRVLKFDGWEGVPLTKPALWSYSKYGMNYTVDKANSMVLYVSWNGHTQIDTFMFYGTNAEAARTNPSSHEWEVLMGGVKKDGFETTYRHPKTYKYVYVEAYNSKSVRLGRSLVQSTFIPNTFMREQFCDELACNFMDTNHPEREEMRHGMKEAYDTWVATTKSKGGEDFEALPGGKYDQAKGGSGNKLLAFILSVGVVGTLVLAAFVIASRTSATGQRFTGNVLWMLGLKTTRRDDESTKGKYSIVDDENHEIDGGRAGPLFATSRNTQDAFKHATEENGLDAEPQLFWRARSP